MRLNFTYYDLIHRVFGTAIAVIFALFISFLAYLYITFNGPLTGDVQVELTPELLQSLQEQKIDTAIGRMDKRASLPDIPRDLNSPFLPQ